MRKLIPMKDHIGPRSEMKVAGKRISVDIRETLERCKRVKMRDLDSVCRSEEMMESNRCSLSGDKGKSQEPEKAAAISLSETAQADTRSKKIPKNSAPMDCDRKVLNADEKCKAHEKEPLNTGGNPKLGEVSECGSTNGQMENKDPMKVWNEMKQNGFLSSTPVSLPAPKKRGRKSKGDDKKRMDLAKKENVDRFAKLAAPCGLLNNLNPGIINNVRNKKQVYSIIEALVRPGKNENHPDVAEQAGEDDPFDVPKNGYLNSPLVNQHTGGLLNSGMNWLERDGKPKKVERWFLDRDTCPLPKNQQSEDDALTSKFVSPTAMASEGSSSLSDESANSSISHQAAMVAFHWLELLQNDIKSRLAALRRSKSRVRSVISTELPLLISREFGDSQENDPYIPKNPVDGCSLNNERANAHRAKWGALFDKMDKDLSEEEAQLELWSHHVKEKQVECHKGLNQVHQHPVNGLQTNYRHHVKEKQLDCKEGLNQVHQPPVNGLQTNNRCHVKEKHFNSQEGLNQFQQQPWSNHVKEKQLEFQKELNLFHQLLRPHHVEDKQLGCQKGLNQFYQHPVNSLQTNYSRSAMLEHERKIAARAAAASIYSTCNFLSLRENVPCFPNKSLSSSLF